MTAKAETLRLSHAQARCWSLGLRDSTRRATTSCIGLRFRGPLSLPILQRSFERLVDRQEALRASFVLAEDEPVQIIQPRATLVPRLVELRSAADPEEQALRLQGQIEAEMEEPFDPSKAPLVRAALLRLARTEHILLITTHGLIADRWSRGVIVRELLQFYGTLANGRSSPLPPLPLLPISYSEILARQRAHDDTGQLDPSFGVDVPVLQLPTDRPYPAVPDYYGAVLSFEIEEIGGRPLRELGRQEGVGIGALLLSAFKCLLHRYTGAPLITVGSQPVARAQDGTECVVGPFAKLMALGTDFSDDPTFRQVLVRLSSSTAASHSLPSFETILQTRRPGRLREPQPLFQAMFSVVQPMSPARLPGLEVLPFEFDDHSARCDLELEVTESAVPSARLRYRTDLFGDSSVARMARHLRALLTAAVNEPDLPVSRLPLLPPDERRVLLEDWDRTAVPAEEKTIHGLFEEQVRTRPRGLAVLSETGSINYRDLNARSNRIAHTLIGAGLERGGSVAILVDHGARQVEAFLGVLKAAGVFVGLDPRHPSRRLRSVLDEARPSFLVADSACLSRHESLIEAAAAICDGILVLDGEAIEFGVKGTATRWIGADELHAAATSNPKSRVGPPDPAYIAYTSGSTGRPKGIVQSHRSFCQFLDWQSREFRIGPGQRFAQWASPAYDASYCEIFGALGFGATLCMAAESVRYDPAALVDWARARRVTLLQLVPSFCQQVVAVVGQEAKRNGGEVLPDLEFLMLAGERLPVDLARSCRNLFPSARLYNLYGPSECVLATYYPIEEIRPDQRSMPIGQAIDGRQVLILDENQQLCPIGVPGEIYVRSRYLTMGYASLPEETARRFIQNPLHDEYDDPVYRTGDLGRCLPDGSIEFHGRKDDLVKLHGNRVELGDIESVLRAYDGVRDGAVRVRSVPRHRRKLVAKERDPRDQATVGEEQQLLVAYFTADGPISRSALREFFEDRLPPHMVPQRYMQLDRLPLNANGKLDVKALPDPEAGRPDLREPYVAPRDRTEARLVEIFESVLGIDGVGVNDGFFELGGDSLLAMQVLNRARTAGLEITFRDLFERQTVARIAHQARHSENGQAAVTADAAPDRSSGSWPLSLAQEGVWFLWRLEPESPYYTGQGTISLRGPLDLDALDRAWTALRERHLILRARFGMENGRPIQEFGPAGVAELPRLDLTDLPEPERRPAMEARVRRRAQRAIDLEGDAVLEAELFQVSETEHEIALTFHEIILDLWALSILVRDLAALYAGFLRGEEQPLPEPEATFGDYVVWERDHRRRENLSTQEAHWKRELAGDLPVLDLPLDRRRPPTPTYRGGSHSVMLDADLTAALRSLSASENATLFMTLLAAAKILLRLYSGQDDIIVGAPIANRTGPSAESLVGFFLNMLPLRTRFEADWTFRELLQKVRTTVTGAITHGEYPFAWMLESLNVARDRSVSPVFQVMFNMLNLPQTSVKERGLEFEFSELDTGYTKYDLSFYAQEHGDQIFLEIAYLTDLFDPATIDRMMANLLALLRSVVADPDAPIDGLGKLSGAERNLLVHELNATDRDFGIEPTLQELFEKQVRTTPHSTAYIFERRRLTYAELNARANRLAHYLRRRKVQPGAPVAVCVPRSFDMVVALIAVMKAGATYVALDPEYPLLRLQDILADVGPSILILRSDVDRFQDFTGEKIFLDADRERIEKESDADPECRTRPDDLLNIVYTSSTTGRPKGTLIGQDAVLNRLYWMWEDYPFRPGDVAVVQKSYALVAATWELFGGLLKGIPTVILSDEETLDPALQWRTLVGQHVSHILASPAFYERLLDQAERHPGEWQTLRLATTSAEPIAPAMVFRWRESFPGVPLLNLYGATECASNVTVYDTGELPEDATRVPIGRPLPNTRVYVVDRNLEPVPIGVTGEMCVAGACLAQGYLNLPELTAERFVENPFDGGSRLYRTGDLARVRADGVIELLGRADDQVNIRGFRVELADVEAALAAHEQVVRCSVRLYENDGRRRLVAYLVTNDELSSSEVRRSLQDRLPDYMIPSDYLFLDELPLTPSGKVDRQALPAPDRVRPELEVEFVPPRTVAEKTIARVWGEVLGLERIGIRDNFFELGGHSLLATRVAYGLREALGVEVPLVTIFRAPTVADLAAEIGDGSDQEVAASDLPTIEPNPGERYLPFSLTDVQEAYWIGRSGSFELGNVATHFYAEVECGDLDLPRFERAWQRLVERHDMLRAVVLEDGRQQILEHVPDYEFHILDLRGRERTTVETELAAVRSRMSHQVLQADEWPLFEIGATLLEDRVRLHFSFDALICDAFSKRLLFREWFRLYQDPETELPPLELSFRDYVLAQSDLESSEAFERALDYWMSRLETLPPAPQLPLARSPASIGQPRFVTRTARLDAATWSRLKSRGTRAGLTPSGLTLACFAEVLKLWSKSPRLTVNMTLFNRLPLHPQVNDVVGDFTSLNLLEVDNSGCDTFEARARRIQEQLWDDLDHRFVSGVRVLRELARRQEGAPRAVMPVVFTSVLTQDAAPDDPSMFWMGDVVHTSYQTPQVWLDHAVVEEAGGLELIWTALEELFPEGMLQEMLQAYGRLLRRLADDPAAWETDWDAIVRELLPHDQLEQRAAVNATEAPVAEALLHTLFAEQVEERADRPAVVAPARALTYRQLYRQANRLGRHLRELGVRPNQLVPVVMEKGWEQIVGVLGVLTSGAAYVPIDAGLPQQRLDYLLDHARADLAVTCSRFDECLSWPKGIRRVCVDGEELDAIDDSPVQPVQQPDDLAYVIYTSGSTGQPKGVMIDHRGAVNTILDINRRFQVSARDRVLALSSLSFDLSVYDIFGMLAAGGTIVLPSASGTRDPAHWAEAVVRTGVTIWNTVPALMQLFVEYSASRDDPGCGSLRLALLSGDWIPVTLPDAIRALCPDVDVVSLGGATEASIWSILYPIEDVDPDWPSIPYGRPMTNQSFHVLSESLQPCPVWVPGQLYIGGIGLAKGYWRDEEKTRASFITHPRTGVRLYRTGDLGRYLPDGNIEFLGREDFQVKIQGHRIELGEVEAALLQHEGVGSAVVTVRGGRHENRRLVAYVVPTGDPAPDEDDLRAFLADELPGYMLPSAYIHLPELPLTSNGKVDRKALPEPTEDDFESLESAATGAADASPRLRQISDVIARVTRLGQVGPDDNLLSLGATSIDMIRIVNLLDRDLGFRPRMDEFYRDPTASGLLRLYERSRPEPESPAAGTIPKPPAESTTFQLIRDPEERDAFKRERHELRRDDGGRRSISLADSVSLDDLRTSRRRSHRRFLKGPLPLARLSELLGCLRRVELDGKPRHLYASAGGLYPVQTYLYVKPDRVGELAAGTYYYHPLDHRLVTLSEFAGLPDDVYDILVNRPIFEESAFAIFLIVQMRAIAPLYGEFSFHFATIEAGLMTQLLETTAPTCGIGLCQIGSLAFDRIRDRFALDDGHRLVHSLLGGRIGPELNGEPRWDAEVSDRSQPQREEGEL